MSDTPEKPPRRKYTPRHTRNPEAVRGVQWTSRDVKILRLVAEHRVLSRELVLLALGISDPRGKSTGTQVKKRLRAMFHAKLLDEVLPPRGETFDGDVVAYSLTASGRTFLRKRQLELPLEYRSEKSPETKKIKSMFARHTMMEARFRLSLEAGLRECPGYELAFSFRENGELELVWKDREKRFIVAPDAFLGIQEPHQEDVQVADFVECDRDTMDHRRLVQKLENYELMRASGRHRKFVGIDDFRVLLVGLDEDHAGRLLYLVHDVSNESPLHRLRDRVYVTAESSYLEQPTNICAQIWRRADQPEQRAAIVSSPLRRRMGRSSD